MKEIKFRAWSKHIPYGERFHTQPRMRQITMIDLSARTIGTDYIDQFEVNDCVLMQYTGLKDKNGVEIYEGDIVAISLYTNRGDFELENGVIKWSNNSSAFKWYSVKDDPSDDNNYWLTNQDSSYREVIGNIYENPELLEAQL